MSLSSKIAEMLKKKNILVEQNVLLKYHVSYCVGGPCKLLVKPNSFTDMQMVVSTVQNAGMRYYILGNGSNVLVSDNGFDGMIILTSGLSNIELSDEMTISSDAGVSLSKLCTFAYTHSLSGLEFAFGIPGSVGGAIYMNAGAYGGEMKDVISSVSFYERTNKLVTLPNEKLDFSYRRSCFENTKKVILKGEFVLRKAHQTQIKAKMDDYIKRRKSKQPLEFPSAGSTFKRPDGNYASALIEKCGLKGYSVGGAQVSTKHSGFIINKGGATCEDILKLIEYIQMVVFEQTGYKLECEVKKLGF